MTLVGSALIIFLIFCVVLFVLFVFVLCLVVYGSLDCPFLITHLVLSHVYSLTIVLTCASYEYKHNYTHWNTNHYMNLGV